MDFDLNRRGAETQSGRREAEMVERQVMSVLDAIQITDTERRKPSTSLSPPRLSASAVQNGFPSSVLFVPPW
jgi:hypothetical protein